MMQMLNTEEVKASVVAKMESKKKLLLTQNKCYEINCLALEK
jgi:hypothetical protein